jgi:hemoglobin
MDELPQAVACRAIHPQDLAHSEQKLFEFLSGWLGGPPLFEQRRGAPMLRQRHLAFPIATAEAEGWLACFRQALEETGADAALRAWIEPRVEALGQHMRNRVAA